MARNFPKQERRGSNKRGSQVIAWLPHLEEQAGAKFRARAHETQDR